MARYTYVWEFIVDPEHVEAFQRQYGPNGAWVSLFARAPGYVETLLLRDRANPQRFVTIDRWETADAYRSFRSAFSSEYTELDAASAQLTAQEVSLGAYDDAIA
jgi:heme-degrading monooxygenase HmoA